MPFPPAPTSSIDWTSVGFKVREVNGHMSSTYSVHTQQWTTPTLVASPYLPIHGMAPGLNYGQQCYEGLKALRTPSGQVTIFRPSLNAARFARSAAAVAMPSPPESLFLQMVHLAVAHNAEFVPPHETGASMYVRPLLFGSSAQLGLSPPEEYTFVVFVMPTGVYHGAHPVACLLLEDFDRAAPKGMGAVKVGGNYAPVLIHSEKARKEGYGITLHVDSQTREWIDEFSTSGFIGVQYTPGGGRKVVIADSENVIKSVTVRSVEEIARGLGWEVERRRVRFSEVEGLDEVMAAGTAASLVPIKSITRRSDGFEKVFAYGDENPPVFLQLLNTLKGIQSGKLEDKYDWCEVVQEPAHDAAVASEEREENITEIGAL